ncbi:MAG: magnesium transporter CorA family protein [Proteobacteria bacterium]|nr:magnesium transporter CorA family protein [Pseudomonadota bacterium]MBU4294662.1 magnesium transporter CorA family protein [Pseudomonadota bacterium]MCG2748871.1 magnesium transporter CorA family protein [Desulfobulbaceae bacterium]
MLTYMKHQAGRFENVDTLEGCQIVRVVAPTQQEISLLQDTLHIPADFLMAAMDRDERPRIEIDDPCRLVILRIPHHDESSDTPYVTLALALILTPTHIITVCSQESMLWRDLLTVRHRLPPPEDRVSFLSALFLQVARQYLVLLRQIRDQADAAENAIHGSMKNEMLIRMLNLEKCLVFFTTSLRANEPLWDRFRRIHGRDLTEDEKDLIDDIKIEFRQAQELADIYSNILSGMMDAFASVIANNLNVVMKLLTSITIILMLPTLIASIYGMNVELPLQHSPHAFLIPMVLSFVLSAIAITVFFFKKWF